MLGKKDNHDIFNQYKSILLEQAETKSFQSFIDKVRAANFDQRLKSEILELFGNPMVERAYNILHRVGDADTAGYASYPEATPAQDDQETANEPDPKFGKELAREREKQQKENPERLPEDEEQPSSEADFFGDSGPLDFNKLGPMKFEKPVQAPVSAPRPRDPSIYRKDVTAQKPATETIPNKIAGFFSGDKSRVSSSGKSDSNRTKDPNWAHNVSEWERGFARGARGEG